jgi:CBS domain-containing protein
LCGCSNASIILPFLVRSTHAEEAALTLIQAMQRRPAVTTPEATLRSAAKQMASERAALLPVVVAGGRLIGTLSALDLTARTIGGGLDPERRTVRAVMRPDPPVCRPTDSLSQVHAQMRALRLPTLPVVEARGELVGLVDLFDIDSAADHGVAAGPEPEMARRVRGEPV